jgi:hypothetical protein
VDLVVVLFADGMADTVVTTRCTAVVDATSVLLLDQVRVVEMNVFFFKQVAKLLYHGRHEHV